MEFSNELGLGTGNITSYGRTVYAISLTKAATSLQRSIGMHLLISPGPKDGDFAKQRVALSSYAYLERIAIEEYKGGGSEEDAAKLETAEAELKTQAARSPPSRSRRTTTTSRRRPTRPSWSAPSPR